MKLSDLRPLPSINEELDTESSDNDATKKLDIESSNVNKPAKDIDNKHYSLAEINTLYEVYDPDNEYASEFRNGLRFIDILLSDHFYGAVAENRNYVIRKKEIKSSDEAIASITFNGWTHGDTYESDKTTDYKGVAKVLTDIMLDKERPYNYGRPYRLEELAEKVKEVSSYSAKPWTIARRFSDLRQCYNGYSIVYFKGEVEIDGKVIKDNFYIMADNGQGNSGIFRKSDMLDYQNDYEWIDWFDDKDDNDGDIDTEEDE